MADRSMTQGEVWAIPVKGLGWCAAVVARAPEPSDPVGFGLIYVRTVLSDQPPKPRSLPSLTAWDEAWIGLASQRPFRNGRWTRCGALPGFDPAHWPVPPWGSSDERQPDLSAIETTRDAPTMTVIATSAASPSDAAAFPPLQVMTAPSRLEKGLVDHFKGRAGNPIHDMRLRTIEVSEERVQRWIDLAASVRSDPGATEPDALPAGRRTDRDLRAGAWLAFPVAGGGFGVARLAMTPPNHLRHRSDAIVFGMAQIWDRWPRLEDLGALDADDSVVVAQTSTLAVCDGRWRVLGCDEEVDPDRWPAPYPWHRNRFHVEAGSVAVVDEDAEIVEIPFASELFGDLSDGQLMTGVTFYHGIERRIGAAAAGHDVPDRVRVTPERMARWRRTNAYIADQLGTSVRNLWITRPEPSA